MGPPRGGLFFDASNTRKISSGQTDYRDPYNKLAWTYLREPEELLGWCEGGCWRAFDACFLELCLLTSVGVFSFKEPGPRAILSLSPEVANLALFVSALDLNFQTVPFNSGRCLDIYLSPRRTQRLSEAM